MKTQRKPGAGADKLKAFLKNVDTYNGKVGWFKDAKYEDGTPVALVAATQEFGSPTDHIPPRPMMRPTIASKQNYWKQVTQGLIKQFLDGAITFEGVMDGIGQTAAADVQKTITLITTPPLSVVTLAARKAKRPKGVKEVSDKPLIDSGYLLATLTNTVDKK